MIKTTQEQTGLQSRLNVPFMELKNEHRLLREQIRSAWEAALDSAAFVGGGAVEQFENSFAQFCEVKHAVGVANGTDALLLALKALGIGVDDEVITVANSFVATAEAIVHAGATPVFVDADPKTYTIDINKIEDAITPRTKAIIPVRNGSISVYHLYVVRVEKGKRNGLQEYLRENGVQTGIHYPAPIHRTPAFSRFHRQSCPVAEDHAHKILSLPMYPEIERLQVEYVVKLVKDYMQSTA